MIYLEKVPLLLWWWRHGFIFLSFPCIEIPYEVTYPFTIKSYYFWIFHSFMDRFFSRRKVFLGENGFLSFLVLVVREIFSSLVLTILFSMCPSSWMQSCQSISKLGCYFLPFNAERKVSHEEGIPWITFYRRSSSFVSTPMLTSWSFTCEIFVKNCAMVSSFSMFMLHNLFFKELFWVGDLFS